MAGCDKPFAPRQDAKCRREFRKDNKILFGSPALACRVPKNSMKLEQNQLWRNGESLYRIVHLERLSVDYKELDMKDPEIGTHHSVSKKEFCRLIKGGKVVDERTLQ